jgi:hypothetical protein
MCQEKIEQIIKMAENRKPPSIFHRSPNFPFSPGCHDDFRIGKNFAKFRRAPKIASSGMRLWTLHPRYLDAKGLVAAWREALLAQKVLAGGTRGYRNHPQLARFRDHKRPLAAMASFLTRIADEAQERGYHFDTSKISHRKLRGQMDEAGGQLLYEWKHLQAKLRARSPAVYRKFIKVAMPEAHPLFRIVPGGVRDWERT